MARLKPVDFDERLTLVEHLDELRSRLIVSAVVLVVAAGLCLWQNHLLLEIANRPLPDGREPITFSPGEPFITTLTVAVYGALLIALPVLLFQLYSFILPALTTREKRVMIPLLLMVPFLFVAGVVFSYFVVAPAALDFLLNFNADEFNIQIRARDYYSFFGLALISVGILFQIPVVVLGITRLGLVTPRQLAQNRKYAILAIALLAMLLPGTDPITMLIAMVPLILLFEFSIILARVLGGRSERRSLESDPAAGPG
ncbi:MAG: twin-arginine translocase subunit TatC [Solirubrobacterales bacterium]